MFESNVCLQCAFGMKSCSTDFTHEITLGFKMEGHVSFKVVALQGAVVTELTLIGRLFIVLLHVALERLFSEKECTL